MGSGYELWVMDIGMSQGVDMGALLQYDVDMRVHGDPSIYSVCDLHALTGCDKL